MTITLGYQDEARIQSNVSFIVRGEIDCSKEKDPVTTEADNVIMYLQLMGCQRSL